jgi:hypothetical protein
VSYDDAISVEELHRLSGEVRREKIVAVLGAINSRTKALLSQVKSEPDDWQAASIGIEWLNTLLHDWLESVLESAAQNDGGGDAWIVRVRDTWLDKALLEEGVRQLENQVRLGAPNKGHAWRVLSDISWILSDFDRSKTTLAERSEEAQRVVDECCTLIEPKELTAKGRKKAEGFVAGNEPFKAVQLLARATGLKFSTATYSQKKVHQMAKARFHKRPSKPMTVRREGSFARATRLRRDSATHRVGALSPLYGNKK